MTLSMAILEADIATLGMDAIVNAANEKLLPGAVSPAPFMPQPARGQRGNAAKLAAAPRARHALLPDMT